MKKVLAMVLAVVLCIGMGSMAFAADEGDYTANTQGTQEFVFALILANQDLRAKDLKASLSWEDGKEYFDSVELEDLTVEGDINSLQRASVIHAIVVTVKFKGYYGVDDLDVKFDFSLKKGSAKQEILAGDMGESPIQGIGGPDNQKTITFGGTFGWGAPADQDDPDDDTVLIDPDEGLVIFDDEDVKFTTFEFNNLEALSVAGKMSKQGAVNLYLDTAVTDDIKSIMKKNENVDFDVIDFRGAPEFDFTQEVTYSIGDEDVTYYVYEIVNGKAVEVAAKLNADKDAMVWNTRTLGTYVVTDGKIEATAAGSAADDEGKENPETGAADFISAAVALGAVALY